MTAARRDRRVQRAAAAAPAAVAQASAVDPVATGLLVQHLARLIIQQRRVGVQNTGRKPSSQTAPLTRGAAVGQTWDRRHDPALF